MYLKKLEMKGFKSFADKTNIDFNSGISCVVGPNGSGKSNITDAVRWVLGEQKVKSLRGSKMEDIIFSGTKDRKKLGFAEVSLLFDNSENFFEIDFNEVKVTRRVFRSGDSEYLINNTLCRLKDIKEIFVDTGLGTDGYSIIGQGKIDSILSTNKDERRQIFEEAAGIVKYKNRKKESERKLENTDLNLLRVDDILSELKERLDPLKEESEKAKVYLELSKELKDVEVNVFLSNIDKINEKLNSIKNDEIDYGYKTDVDSKQLLELKKIERTLLKEIDELTLAISASKENHFEILNNVKELEGEESLYNEKISNLNKNLTRIENEIIVLEKEKNEFSNNIKSLNLNKDKISSESTEIENDFNVLSEKYEKKNNKIKEIEVGNEKIKTYAIDLLNQIERKKSETISNERIISTFIGSVNDIKEKLSIKMNRLSQNEEEIILIEKNINNLKKKFNDNSFRKTNLDSENRALIAQIGEKELVLNNAHNRITEITTEKKILVQMEKEHEGFDYSVKTAMKFIDNKKGFYGVVASLIELPKKYEKAIEITLGKSLQNIVCESASSAHTVIDYLKKEKKGRVTFLPIQSIKKYSKLRIDNSLLKVDGYIGVASELVNYDEKFNSVFSYLLGKTVIVRDYKVATLISKNFNTNFRIVTLDGEIINQSGSITGGSYKTKISNILSRKRKIKELELELDSIEKIFLKNKSEIELLKKNKFKLEEKIKLIFEELEELKINSINKNNEFENLKKDIYEMKKQIENNNKEIISLNREIESILDKNDKLDEEMNNLALEKNQLDAKLSSFLSDGSIIVSELNKLEEEITEKKIVIATYKEKIDNFILEIDRNKSEYIKTENLVKIKFEEINLAKLEKNASLAKLDEIMIKLAKLFKDKVNASELAEINKNEVATLKVKYSEIQNKILKISNSIENIQKEIHHLELIKIKNETEKENITANLWEKYEMNIESANKFRSNLEIKYPLKVMNKLRKDIKNIGEVNVSSIEEYDDVSERYNFLYDQHKDLVTARKSLIEVIGGLEAKMIEKFKEALEQIDSHFDSIFKELFNGGHSKLIIEDMDDILSSNIEIVAQPPGKKLQSLNLLSGGEKALTAIALLFSILKIKPSPFCILDEIEAALDDVNVYRFANFLNHYTDKSQFIVITHRKGTMEVADSLYGVTMEEFGVSKIVSVKLSDVEK
ncbi:chromosome segregation protein SMC [Helicovermis profundi]|uniref:Chromosome partition protein Smc n=1 Tax=Helicovermis profundi TaxID=3065157 RepID=A0AAU9EDF6_9FIRM|nr:chromosome segregation protein SMC [Clostridia bacterium S502]